MSRLITDPLENASEILEATNLLQGPSPFPIPAPILTPTTTAVSEAALSPGTANLEFDFRPYLDNQYFEPGSYDNQAATGSSAESFLPPQEFERLFSDPVKPSMCPYVMMSVRDMVQDYPLELLQLPDDIARISPGGFP